MSNLQPSRPHSLTQSLSNRWASLPKLWLQPHSLLVAQVNDRADRGIIGEAHL